VTKPARGATMRQEAVSLFLCYLLLFAGGGAQAGEGPRTTEGCGIKTRRASESRRGVSGSLVPRREGLLRWPAPGRCSQGPRFESPPVNSSVPPKGYSVPGGRQARRLGWSLFPSGRLPEMEGWGGPEHQAQSREPRSPLHFVPSR